MNCMDGEIRSELDRIHDEDERQNKRLEILEAKQNDIADLTISVKELAINSKYTAKKVENIDARLDSIEKEPIRTVQEVKATTIKTAVAFALGILLSAIYWLVINHGI